MKKAIVIMWLMWTPAAGQPPETDGWDLFARVKFEAKYIKEANSYFLAPVFDQKIISLAGTEITLKGYYMPMETEQNQLIISKNPYASCFFCGGAGPESVAEALLKAKSPRLKVDQIITVKGKLKLNDKDINHMNFILVEAEIITE